MSQVIFQYSRPNQSIENISVKMWTFQSRFHITITYTFHPTSEWQPSNSKSWIEVMTVRFHVSQHDSRVSVFCPFSREVASWIINLPSCRHCLNVVDWNSVEMIIEMNPGGRSPNRKNHNMDFTFTTASHDLSENNVQQTLNKHSTNALFLFNVRRTIFFL